MTKSFKLTNYDQARSALAAVSTVDEAKDILDKAIALQAYAQQIHDIDMEIWVAKIKLRAAMRFGEISSLLETSPPGPTPKDTSQRREVTSKAEVLKAAGVSTSTAHRYEKLAEHEAEVEDYVARKSDQRKPAAFTEALTAVQANAREKKNAEILSDPVSMELPEGIHLGDFRDLADIIPDESIEMIFTDPPYDAKSSALYEDVARIGARILKPGGSLIAYSGQKYLPQVLTSMSKHLVYWWTIAGVHGGGNQILNKLGIRCGWKPLVWFVKKTRGDVQNIMLDVVSGDREKESHVWQQSQVEAEYLIGKLCPEGGTVVDFCIGGGTTAAACRTLGRRFIGFEIDASTLQRAIGRIDE